MTLFLVSYFSCYDGIDAKPRTRYIQAKDAKVAVRMLYGMHPNAERAIAKVAPMHVFTDSVDVTIGSETHSIPTRLV